MFALLKIQKAILMEFNWLPQLPLWVFLNGEYEKTESFQIGAPEECHGELVFPVEVNGMKERIVFGKKGKDSKKPDLEKFGSDFPKKQRVFRTGTVITESNGWKLFDEKWVKLF